MALPSETECAQLDPVKGISEDVSAGSITSSSAKGLTGDSNTEQDKSETTLRDRKEDISENDESTILRRQVEVPDTPVGVLTLYRYASTTDLCIIAVSCLMSIAYGITIPLMIVIFGNIQLTLQHYFDGMGVHDFSTQLDHFVLYFLYLAIWSFVATYTYTVGFIYTGEHITAKIRAAYLEHVLRQNIAFFDLSGTGEIASQISTDINLIQEALSLKLGLTLVGTSTFVAAFVVGFIEYWKLSLVLMSILVAVVLNIALGSKYMVKFNSQRIAAWNPGASLVGEAISSIRNTVAFGSQERMAQNFKTYLKNVELFGFRAKVTTGLIMAGISTTLNLGYGLAFWVGGQYVVYEGLAFFKVLVTVMVITIGAVQFGNAASNAQEFAKGLAAARVIYRTIDRKSPLDPLSPSGKILKHVQGTVELKNVRHIYPSRPEVVVLDNMSLTVPARMTTALVGGSGCGKSTIIKLMERFYSPVQGAICLDGHDINTLNLRWLRQQVSLVSQEPVLFSTTIYENIKHGLVGSEYESQSHESQRARIIEAAKKANAHNFITSLPKGYETDVGTRGGLLSGGQKQRISIARAIVSDPRVLLLDEATSALDTRSEGVVQEALEEASKGRTTIVIAHRLSTIRNADNIVVMSSGRIVEQGTHDNLTEQRGQYYNLVATQDTAHQASEAGREEGKAWTDMADDDVTPAPYSPALSWQDAGKMEDQSLRTSTPPFEDSLSQHRAGGKENQYSLWDMVSLIASFNGEEKTLMMIGLLFSIICGGVMPVQYVLFAKFINTLSTRLMPSNLDQVKADADFWATMYVVLAGVIAISWSVHGILFAKCSERLVLRARYSVFRSILRQDIGFFDEKHNTPGGLISFLSTKTAELAGLSGEALGNLLMCASTLITGMAVGIGLGWKLGLVSASTIPILIACGYFRIWILAHYERRSKNVYAESTSYAAEAISAIHTVASLTRENDIVRYYRTALAEQRRSSLRFVLRSNILFALSESLTMPIFALCFWYGGTLIVSGEYSMFQYYVCFASVVFSAQSTGFFFSRGANMTKAYTAAQDLKVLFERKPSIDTWSHGGMPVDNVKGHVEFRGVHFHYPTRPDQPVLRGIDIDVQPGQHVALVGSSGCGKSTSISLIERFYDPTKGGIFVDGVDIRTLNVRDYRNFIALVSQEPTLYSGTIRENILLGTPDELVTDDRLTRACRDANIHNFITSLPDGFETVVGSGGVMLSGGQKQRLAIARALIRDPRILLLDEATSALDTESETVIQAALDEAARGRTTITVAHRLSTVRNADAIYVFDQGRIVEQGTYGELVRKNGHFAELVKLQRLNDTS